jgi:hypothetical protein
MARFADKTVARRAARIFLIRLESAPGYIRDARSRRTLMNALARAGGNDGKHYFAPAAPRPRRRVHREIAQGRRRSSGGTSISCRVRPTGQAMAFEVFTLIESSRSLPRRDAIFRECDRSGQPSVMPMQGHRRWQVSNTAKKKVSSRRGRWRGARRGRADGRLRRAGARVALASRWGPGGLRAPTPGRRGAGGWSRSVRTEDAAER